MKIVFMGTPDFALFSLKALTESEHDVVAAVTQPDRPGNRGVTVCSPVKKFATERGIPVYQYEKIGREGAADLKSLGADVYVTAAFGQILTQEILDIPSFGVINVHASLLPKYRGSSPIQWALINGEKETGVTIMRTNAGLDTGDILFSKSIAVSPDDTAGSLFDKLGALGAETLIEYLDLLARGKCPEPIKQDESRATYFPMLKKTDGIIDWSASSGSISDKSRGVTPWPGSYTFYNGKIVKIHKLEICEGNGVPGQVLRADKNGLTVACGCGAVRLLELQAEGKRRMNVADFLNGNRIVVGDMFG